MPYFWYSAKQHSNLCKPRESFVEQYDGHAARKTIVCTVIILPDGKIATIQSATKEHGCHFDDIYLVGEYESPSHYDYAYKFPIVK